MVKVSVIVPVYNVEKYLEKCLKSLVEQSLQEIEIILIDDGSTDSSLDIIKKYYGLYPEKIIYRSVSNGGAAKARNIALEIATGEYIGFVDSDDFVDLSMFEKMYNQGVECDAEIVTCGYHRINMQDIQRRDVRQRKCFGYSLYQAPNLMINNVPYIWNKIFKKSLIQKNGIKFEDLRIFEDLVFTYKLFLKANKIIRVSECLYNYIFLREGSLTHTFGEKRFDIFTAFDSLIQYYKDNKSFYHFETELLFVLLNHVMVVCGNDNRYRDLPLKYKFINKSFSYLDTQFPYWKTTDLYFRKYKKNKFLFTKKTYWRLRSLVPVPFKHWWQNTVSMKSRLKYNRAGAAFAKACRRHAVKPKRILINSQQGKNLSGNMFYLLKYLCSSQEFSNYEIGVAYAKGNLTKFQTMLETYNLNSENITWLVVNTKEYAKYLATAKYLFNDTSFPVYYTKRKEQCYLNTWHGTPLKTLGRSTASDYYDIANLQKNFVVSDYLLYPSQYMEEHMLEDYMLNDIYDNKIMLAGYPRNEIFFDEERRAMIRQEQEMENKQNIAYMPTWRGGVRSVNSRQKGQIVEFLREIDDNLRDDQCMYVNLHPYVGNKINFKQFLNIKPFPNSYETYDFLNACDMLITDYSSVFFDYAITKRKIILFAYDEEEYFENRGCYLKFKDLPFANVKTVPELMDEINREDKVCIDSFIEKYNKYESSNMSERICKTVILDAEEGISMHKLERDSKEKVMVYLNSMKNDSFERFKEAVEHVDLNARNFYYTYNTNELMGREKYMKDLPERLLYFGKLNPFSTASLWQSFLLYKIEKNKIYYKLFGSTLKKAFEKEKLRSYGNTNFDIHVIWGFETAKVIDYVSEQNGIKVLYIDREEEINRNIHPSVYKKYDYVVTANESLKNLVKMQDNNINVCVKEVTKLDDLWN